MTKTTTQAKNRVTLLPPQDALKTISGIRGATTAILDPWYNRGVGGESSGYDEWLADLVALTGEKADHVFVWGFPDIVCRLLGRLPAHLTMVAWLTWYYKNCPSRVRGWRSAQYTCLHLSRPKATLYPNHFLNGRQLELQDQGKLRYMPGPPNVIEAPLNVGFVGRVEQTGHPAQKPEKVFEPLVLMTTEEGDLVVDPFCGSGTTGAVCRTLGRRAVLCDSSEEYLKMAEKRLGVPIEQSLRSRIATRARSSSRAELWTLRGRRCSI